MSGIQYNADEIFAIGVEIEKNGEAFYKKAFDFAKDKEIKGLFLKLANMESDHIKIFEKLRNEISESDIFDPDNEAQRYLKAIADTHIFLVNKDISSLIDKCNTPSDVLKMAVTLEKDSVVLYSSMKKIVPENLGKESINRLIVEELEHVAMLSEYLEQIK